MHVLSLIAGILIGVIGTVVYLIIYGIRNCHDEDQII